VGLLLFERNAAVAGSGPAAAGGVGQVRLDGDESRKQALGLLPVGSPSSPSSFSSFRGLMLMGEEFAAIAGVVGMAVQAAAAMVAMVVAVVAAMTTPLVVAVF
jgi:hypothetical protein